MMQAANAVFLLILFVVGLAVAMAAWTVLLLIVGAFWRKKRLIFLWPLGAVLYVAVVAGWLTYQWSPSTVFKNEFGFAPTADVTKLKSSTWILGDSGLVYMRFDASPATVTKIATLRGLSPSFGGHARGGAPSWWTPSPGAAVYHQTKRNGAFASEQRTLYYDPVTSQTWYQFSGID